MTCDEKDKQQPETTTQINNPPAIELRQECFVRRCDQTITGRDLRYSRALEIIQDEIMFVKWQKYLQFAKSFAPFREVWNSELPLF